MTHSSVPIQITRNPNLSCLFGWEKWPPLRRCSHRQHLSAIAGQVRFARARFGQYEVIDMVAVLIGYILSGEPTLLAFYERLAPFAEPFMALFGRNRLPHRSTLSRFLAALDQASVETLRTLFQKDLLARKPFPSPGGLFDRTGGQWAVIDVDGTRATARQRALPQTDALPLPHRRFDQVCAHGLHGTQARRSGSDKDRDSPGTYAPSAWHVWKCWQWRLSWGTQARDWGDYELRNPVQACSPLFSCG